MKSLIMAMFLFVSAPIAHAQEPLYIQDLGRIMGDDLASQGASSWNSLPPEVRRAILQEAQSYESAAEKARKDLEKRMVVITPAREGAPEPVKVFGFTEKEVLEHDGDPQGAACSSRHNQGDLSNRWCHAYFVKLTDSYLRSKGVNKSLSAVLSASIFVPKEYLYDLHPSPSDLVMAEYEVYGQVRQKKTTRITVTVFGDKAAFFTLQKQF